jgi:plastocyanin
LIDETARITGEVKENEIVIRILRGAYQPSLFGSFREGVGGQEYYQENTQRQSVGYFFPERLTITPGITLTFFNDDIVSHKIVSAKRDTNSRGIGNPVPDGKIVGEEIQPGGSWSYTNEQIGFIFLMDPDYPWMSMDITSFSELNPDVIGSQKNRIQTN